MKGNIVWLLGLVMYSVYAQDTGERDSAFLKLKKNVSPMERVNTYYGLAKYYITKPGEYKADLDSAVYFIKKAETINIKLNSAEIEGRAYVFYSKVFREGGEIEKAQSYLDKAIRIVQNNPLYFLEGQVWFENFYFFPSDDIEKKIEYLKKSVAAFEKSKVSDKEYGDALTTLADYQGVYNHAPEMITNVRKAIEIYQQVGEKQLMVPYNLLSKGLIAEGIYDDGIKYGLMAAKIGEGKHDTSGWMMAVYNNIGRAYYYLRYNELAVEYMRKSLDIAITNNDWESTYSNLYGVCNILEKQKKYNDALKLLNSTIENHAPESTVQKALAHIKKACINSYMGNYNEAKPSVWELEVIIDKESAAIDSFYIVEIYAALVVVYIELKNVEKATYYFNKLKKESEKRPTNLYVSNILGYQYKIDLLSGDYKKAIEDYRIYKKVFDSVTQISKRKLAYTLQIRYDTQKKDNELLLKEKNIQGLKKSKQLQAAIIKKKSIISVISVLFVVVFFFISYHLYKAYQLRKKAGESLKEKQEIILNKNVELSRLVEDKEWLLSEIHTRVKRNLEIIMNLLNSQTTFMVDAVAINAINSSRHRLNSMALIHNRLFSSNNLSSIRITDYFKELVAYLQESFGTKGKIEINLQLADVEIPVTQAVPLGLILNEAITNTIKYAFPESGCGKIEVALESIAEEYYILTIQDNGVGLPPGFDISGLNSLGMKLMRGLCRDLEAEFFISGDSGTKIQLKFPAFITLYPKQMAV